MEQRQPTPAERLLCDILLVLKLVLAELQKKPNKPVPKKKQGLLWKEPPPPKVPDRYAVADAEYEARKAQNERELQEERERKNGVVVDKVARAQADRLMERSRKVVGS